MRIAVLFFLFNVLLNTAFISAQELNLAFESIGMKEGLDAGDNYYLTKDSEGLIWIGSDEGVFKFDGVNLIKYTSNISDTTTIIDDYVQSDFIEDEQGDMWFATVTGINVYHKSLDIFERIQLKNEEGDLLDFDYHLFYLEKNQFLWIRIGNEIYKYDILKKDSEKIIDTNGISFGVSLDITGTVSKIYSCPMISKSGFEVISKNDNGDFRSETFLTEGVNGKPLDVRTSLVGQDSIVWFCTRSGLIRFNSRNEKVELIPLPEGKKRGLDTGVFLNKEQLLLAGHEGMWLFDMRKNNFRKYFDKGKSPLNKWDYRGIKKLYIDQEDILWFSKIGAQGIDFSWLHHLPFSKPLDDIIEEPPLINSIVEDKNGNVWVLSEDNEVFLFGADGFLIGRNPFSYNIGESASPGRLATSPEGRVFLLLGQEIFYYNENKLEWEKIYNAKKNRLYFFKPISDGSILVTSKQGLLNIYKNNENAWETKLNSLPVNALQSFQFYFIDKNKIVFPVANNSIQLFQTGNEGLEKIHEILVDFEVFNLSESFEKNTWWLGTNNGVKQLKLNNDSLILADTEIGLNQSVSYIFENNKSLWFSSFNQLHFWDIVSRQTFSFGIDDGLPDNNFPLHYAALKSKEGRLWWGTRQGLVHFHSSEIQTYPLQPRLKLINLEINEETQEVEDTLVKLRYFQNDISFVLQSISTFLPNENKIFYRFLGYEDSWLNTRSGDRLRFYNLAPGNYCLEYLVENSYGIKGKVYRFAIQISKPFWETWWFILSAIFLIGGFIYLSVQVYLQQQLKRKQRIIDQQIALQEERSRIAGELHDDLGSDLSIIKFLSDDLKSEQASQSINRINQSSIDLLEKMRDIIWAMNVQNDTLEDLIIYVSQYTYEYLETCGIEAQAKIPERIEDYKLSGKKRRNIVLVIKEALHNIAKHSKADFVQLDIAVIKKELLICLTDNGIGFNKEEKSRTGNGLRNMQKRMKSINGIVRFEMNEGTKLEVKLPLVETMNES